MKSLLIVLSAVLISLTTPAKAQYEEKYQFCGSRYSFEITNVWQGESKFLSVKEENGKLNVLLEETKKPQRWYTNKFSWTSFVITAEEYGVSMTSEMPSETDDPSGAKDVENPTKINLSKNAWTWGKFWDLEFIEGDTYRIIHNASGKCLDIVNDGTNNKVQLAERGDYSGQYWKIKNVGKRG